MDNCVNAKQRTVQHGESNYKVFELGSFFPLPTAALLPFGTRRGCANMGLPGESQSPAGAHNSRHTWKWHPRMDVHSPALRAHTSVSEGSQVQLRVQTQDPCALLSTAPEDLPRRACLVHWVISDSAPWTACTVNPHTQARCWLHSTLGTLCSSFRSWAVWGYIVSQALIHGGTGILEHVAALSTGRHPTLSPS